MSPSSFGELLDPATLAEMRALQLANMPSTCVLVGYAQTRLAGAEYDLVAVVMFTGPCRLVNAGASEGLSAEQRAAQASSLLHLPVDAPSGAERAIVSGTTNGAAWQVELVLAGEEDPRSYSATRRIRANLAPSELSATEPVATVVVSEV